MRGHQERTGPLFSYVSTEDRIPKAHPLLQVRLLADQALDRLQPVEGLALAVSPQGARDVPHQQNGVRAALDQG